MESFLTKLNQNLLKNHCSELKLETSGKKKDLIER